MIFISLSDAIEFHDIAIERLGGLSGLRNSGLLESALNQPIMMFNFGDQEIDNLAAAYFFHIIKNHPFIDGNKRTGLLVMIRFLNENGFTLKVSFEDLYQLAIDTAASKKSKEEIALFVKKNIQIF
jgi:death-on-curing protein